MADCQHAHHALVVIELVDDPVGADSKRSQPAEPPPKGVTRRWFALEDTESLEMALQSGQSRSTMSLRARRASSTRLTYDGGTEVLGEARRA